MIHSFVRTGHIEFTLRIIQSEAEYFLNESQQGLCPGHARFEIYSRFRAELCETLQLKNCNSFMKIV